jgi:hypothetical protein
MKLDKSFHLIEPNVGDAESRSVHFEHPDVVVKLKLAQSDDICSVRIGQCRLFSMTTDHPQNVVDGVIVGTSAEHVGRSANSRLSELVAQELSKNRGQVVHVEPLIGCGLIAVGDDVEITVTPGRRA